MKKLTIFIFIAALLAGTVSAQPIKDQREAELQINKEQQRGGNPEARGDRHERPNRQDQSNSVSIEGTLKLEKGFVAVQSGETVYLVPMLNRYIGFISGLKEGEKVTIEGREFRKMIQPIKVTIGEKSYDFIAHPYNASPRGSAPAFGKQNFNQCPDNKKYGRKYDRKKPDYGRKGGHDRGRTR